MITRQSDGTYAIPATDLYALIGQLSMTQLATDAGQAPITPPPVVTPPTPPPTVTGFKGLFAFSGDTSTLVNNPSVHGCVLKYAWSDLEPTQGQINFAKIDSDMAPWVAAGKEVILRISTSGWKGWSTPPNGSYTPAWVYKLGVKSVTSGDGAIKPQYWSSTFLNQYGSFLNALGARYDGNPNIAFIEMGIGDGGETSVDTRKTDALKSWQAIGYSDAVWLSTIKQIVGLYKLAFPTKPLVIMPDNSFIGGTSGYGEDVVLTYAAGAGIGLQDNGLVTTTVLKSSSWKQAPFIVSEQRDQLSQTPGVTLKQLIDVALGSAYGASYVLLFSQDLAAADQTMLASYLGKSSTTWVKTQ